MSTHHRYGKLRMFAKKRLVSVIALIVLLTAGGAAYAFWTAGGSGTGSAQTGNGAGLTVTQTSLITNLRPGGSAQELSGAIVNTGDAATRVASLGVAVGPVTKAAGAVTGTCDASDYTIANAPVPIGTDVLPGVPTLWRGATIQFNNKPTVNQDACKGATVTINYTINNTP